MEEHMDEVGVESGVSSFIFFFFFGEEEEKVEAEENKLGWRSL